MCYYLEMRDKYGFNDGELIPAEADAVRSILVEAINAYLGPDSEIEAYEYDRPGMHNSCMIMYRNKKTGEDVAEGIADSPVWRNNKSLCECIPGKTGRCCR